MNTQTDERVLPVNGVELGVQTFGDAAAPAVLLIGGAASSMDWWEEEFCQRLAAGGRYVIRYDLRDTGRSTSYPPGEPGYAGPDLVADAVALLDALGVATAHLVAISLGGGMAQRIALDHPERVDSLTLISTSPGGPGAAGDDLPPMAERLAKSFAEPSPDLDWGDRDAVIDYTLDAVRQFAGSVTADEARIRRTVGRAYDRSRSVASQNNHWMLEGGEPVRPRLGEITAPTLVMHGTEDPLFPYGHAEALAREIPGSRLVPLPGVGHEVPPPQVWDLVLGELLPHTNR